MASVSISKFLCFVNKKLRPEDGDFFRNIYKISHNNATKDPRINISSPEFEYNMIVSVTDGQTSLFN
jgi:hypothetical protein